MTPSVINLAERPPTILQMNGRNEIMETTLTDHGLTASELQVTTADEALEIVQKADIVIIRSKTQFIDGHEPPKEGILRISPGSIAQNGPSYIIRGGVGVKNIAANIGEHGIIYMNTPEATTESVAEHGETLIKALFKKLGIPGIQVMREGKWVKHSAEEYAGKDALIVGAGRIGTSLASKLASNGMNVKMYDPFPQGKFWLPNGRVGKNGKYTDEDGPGAIPIVSDPEEFHHLLGNTDVVSINTEAPGVLGEEEIRAMGEGRQPYIINTARGNAIDEIRILAALKEGKLRGVGMDVAESEDEAFFDSAGGKQILDMLGKHNVILTTHMAGNSEEGQDRVGVEMAEHIINLRNGSPSMMGAKFMQELGPERVRFIFFNRNEPDALGKVSSAFGARGINLSEVTVKKDPRYFGNGGPVDMFAFDVTTDPGKENEVASQVADILKAIPDTPIIRAIVTKKHN